MRVRNKYLLKPVSLFLVVTLVYQLVFPVCVYALTGGPSAPETETFAPVSSSDMVDLFTGDFKYNIPLIDVGGYPINLIYNSNPTMDQEASWVGLGWNVNPGAVNRTMRGMPDDFKGDEIKKEYNIKENRSWGVDLGLGVKIAGLPLGFNSSLGISSNNYRGYGITAGTGVSISASKGNNGGMTGSLGINFSSQDGVSLSASVGMETKEKNDQSFSNSLGLSYNNRAGLKDLTFSSSVSKKTTAENGKTSTASQELGGASMSFAATTFTPTISMPLENHSFTLAGTVGGEITIVHPNATISGFWSEQKLQSKSRTLPAYGYLNSAAGHKDLTSLMDFNREKDVPYVKGIPNLPVPNYTFDLFNANGQGVQGQFRPHRSDVGILYDSQIGTTSSSTSGGIELGFGYLFHWGFYLQQLDVLTTTEKWNSSNNLIPSLDFINDDPYIGYESSYFESVGELSVSDSSFIKKIGYEEPIVNKIVPVICTNKHDFNRYSIRTNAPLSSLGFYNKTYKQQRAKRTQLFSCLNALEATAVGFSSDLLSYHPGVMPYNPHCEQHEKFRIFFEHDMNSFDAIPRTGLIRKPHHISEITVTKPDGKRYIYGIPVYNYIQKDVTFNCKNLNSEPVNGLVQYDPTIDNTDGNKKGLDNYYNAETVPPYAYSYLLTSILSPDYHFYGSVGRTSSSVGEEITLNYSRVSTDYRWRVPYEKDSASYNGGLNAGNGHPQASTGGDAKGTYSYGVKELWYMHSLESKTMIAMFYLEDRHDATGVIDENGGYNSSPSAKQKLLKEIKLFSKSDVMKYGDEAIPVKTVHFVYDYSLCPNVSNNAGLVENNTGQYSYYMPGNFNSNKGKLTLRKVYFTYGNNTRGQLNSYQFTYNSFNPSYGLKNYDRWGNYKSNSTAGLTPMNAEYPYTIQDRSYSDQFSQAWNLQKISLPSGGNIQVDLEADDYSYVQDRRAGQMFFVRGMGSTPSSIDSEKLYDDDNQYNYIFIKVGDSGGDIQRKFLEGIGELYYRFFVDMGNSGQKDYISGYVEFDKSDTWYGVYDASTIFVKVKRIDGINPIAKSCWQFVKSNLPEVAYPGSNDPGGNLEDALLGLIGSVTEVVQIVFGEATHAKKRGWGKKFNPVYSWVRLDNPGFNKIGGGSRVKQITISDNWDNMAPSGVVKTYGQQYLYADTTDAGFISSGVACWEPSIGNDENPFKQPVHYKIPKPLIKDDWLYFEEPFGESFFPAPVVGYSKVTVANISNEHIRRTATGYTTNEFYTARDFPVVTAHTNPDFKPLKPAFKPNFLGSSFSLEYNTISQGYMVELNDMHGKEKAVKVYNAMGAEISSNYYYYKEDSKTITGKRRISSKGDVVFKEGGEIKYATIGEQIDMCMDMRQQTTRTVGAGLTFNTENFVIAIIWVTLPPLIPNFTFESKRFRSAVNMKVVNRFGILDRIVATKDGSTIETANLLRDAETGEVLMTRTQNEFGDSLYNFTYPAHWAYNNMGPAYINTGLVLRNVQIQDGDVLNMANPFDYLNEGDELMIYKDGVLQRTKYHVARFEENGKLKIMGGLGVATILREPSGVLADIDIKVLRSGRRNMQTTPVGSFATIHQSPASAALNKIVVPTQSIVQAAATEFNDKWKIECNKVTVWACDTTRPEFCLDHFVNLMINNNSIYFRSLFNACSDDSITVGDIFRMCNCTCMPDSINGEPIDSMPFYNPACSEFMEPASHIQWAFGNNCFMNMSSYSGDPVDLDSLQTIDPINTTENCSKVYVGANHTDSVLFCIECYACHDSCLDQSKYTVTSPYENGMYNNWHPKKTWAYYSRRTKEHIIKSRIRDDGTFKEFTPFWDYNSTSKMWDNNSSADANWVATNTVTRINTVGTEVENKDALDRYSAALYGYLETLPKSIASNARYKQIANDNFEDYTFRATCHFPCLAEHWNFEEVIDSPTVYVSDLQSHTGSHSLFISSGNTASVFRDIKYIPEDTLVIEDTVYYRYQMYNGCLGKFSPDSGRYLLSAWVKEDGDCGALGYSRDSIKINFSGAPEEFIFYPSGPVIDGWQRYEGIFDVPSAATGITVALGAGDVNAWFDDVRIHPYHSNMKSFVNDARNLRLMSELDANNYATFYEYDDEGKLVRVKKETERGIMTLKESRSIYTRQ